MLIMQQCRMLAAGLGITSDPTLVQSVTRTGTKQELLQGPMIYCASFVAIILMHWRQGLPGIVAVGIMCGGDGTADLAGR
jgi:hypothetical protein